MAYDDYVNDLLNRDNLSFASQTDRFGVQTGVSYEYDPDQYFNRLSERLQYGTVRSQQQSSGFDNRFTRNFMGAVRGVAGALEPLQLPKDVFDALVAGGLDPDTTISERLGRLSFRSYIPFGDAPPRAATGDEILGLMGVEEGRARQIGGVAFDLFADPLLAGAYLRVAGGLGRSQKLIQVGNQIERAMSPAGWDAAATAVIPGKKWVNRRTTEVVNTLLNKRVFWGGDDALTYGDYALSRTAALRRQFGKDAMPDFAEHAVDFTDDATGQRFRVNVATGEALQDFGSELSRRQGLARQKGRNVSDRALDLLEEAQRDVLGTDGRSWLRKAGDILTRGRMRAERTTRGIPRSVQDTIFAQGYDVGDQVGVLARNSFRPDVDDVLPEVMSQFQDFTRRSAGQDTVIRKARAKVAKAATDAGFDPQEAVRRFNSFTDKIVEADALMGFHLSGYEPIKKLFYRRMFESGMTDFQEVRKMWTDVLERGIRGDPSDDIMAATELAGYRLGDVFEGTLVGKGKKTRQLTTLSELLEPVTQTYNLNFGTYLKNLRQGHMRRSFGLFQNPTSFKNYMANLESGRLIPSNIMDDVHVTRAFGADTDVRRAFDSYMEGIAPTAPSQRAVADKTARSRGVVVRQSSVMEGIRDHLVANKVAPREASRRANEAVKSLIGEMQAGGKDSPINRLLDEVYEVVAKHESNPLQAVRPGMGGSMFRQREELTGQVLEKLGELALPQVSLRETARATRSQVAWTEFLTDSYRQANRFGFISSDNTWREGTRFVPVPEDPNIWGPFAGTHVHPMLKKELTRAMRDKSGQSGQFGRVRSLITGGYLASPNVITANLFGGVYTSALMGISPPEMFRELANTFVEFRRSSKDPSRTFLALDDLKRHISVDDTTLIDANIDEVMRQVGSGAVDAGGLQNAFNRVTREFQNQLDAPAGQKWAGLDGFQFVENWMKVSAFQARRRVLASRMGVSMDEFGKQFADRSAAARVIDAQAAEAARIAVFDYSEIPEGMRLLRDKGLMLFPGFPFFLTARTANAAMKRPGVLGAYDRASDAINTLQMDEDTKREVYASMPEWLQDSQGVAVPGRSFEDENGDVRRSVLPFNQLIPTSTLLGNPWGESLASVGIWKPFVELGSAAFITRDGEAPFSQTYGQQVYQQGLRPEQQLAQSMGFLANTLAPGAARKLMSYTPGTGFDGMLPALKRQFIEVDGPLADTAYTAWEVENRRADRRLWDEMIAATVRSPQVITTSGPLANIRKNVAASQFALGEEISALRERRDQALLHGNQFLATKMQRRIDRKRREWAERMAPALEAMGGVE